MSTDKQIHLLDDLQILLEKQIEFARENNVSSVEVLSRQADSLVEEITQTGILKLPEFRNRREHLRKLYDSLCLAVMAQRADVSEKLSRVRKGKKMVGIYRSNV